MVLIIPFSAFPNFASLSFKHFFPRKMSTLSKRNIAVFSSLVLLVGLSCLFYVFTYNSVTLSGFDYTNVSDSLDSSRPAYRTNKPLQCLPNTANSPNVTKQEWEQCLDPGEKPEYYLSVVLVTRMDDYAG